LSLGRREGRRRRRVQAGPDLLGGIMRTGSVLAAASAAIALAGAAHGEATGSAGAGTPINNYQPSIVLNQLISLGPIYPGGRECLGCEAATTMGMIHTFAAPYNAYSMPAANGQTMLISTNTPLYSLMSVTYGGNGATTFALPDLAGRVAVGVGLDAAGGSYDIGQQGGTATTVMTLSQLAEHDHDLAGGGLSGAAGGSEPIDNRQPYLAMNYQIAVDGTAVNDSFLGSVSLYAGIAPSVGGLPADGRLLQIDQFSALYQLIGTTYGGDGETTFALPNLNGRVVVGAGGGITLGETFGQLATTLTEANLASHDHSLPGGGLTDPTGGSLPFDNAQLSLALNYFINTGGLSPQIGSGSGLTPSTAWLGEIVAAVGGTAPQGWMLADGQLLSIADNQNLFNFLGCNYGGDCVNTFALPDLRGRTIVGAGVGFNVGDLMGERFTTLSEANLAPHVHSLLDGDGGGPSGVPEPVSWVLMIGGFACAGASLRRLRTGAVRDA
jgi:microcystin-dependent protein